MKTLKHQFALFLSVMILCMISSMQADAQKKGEFGLRFMPTFTSMNMNTSSGGVVKGEVTLGYGVGAFLGFNFTDHVGIQAELIYSSLTQKYEDDNQVTRKINIRYVNVPLLLSLNTGKSNAVNFNIVGGPQLGVAVKSSISTEGGLAVDENQPVLSVKGNDLGLAYGAGFDFGLNAARTIRLGFGFRGVFGIVDISKGSKTESTDSYYVLDRTHLRTYAIYGGLSLMF